MARSGFAEVLETSLIHHANLKPRPFLISLKIALDSITNHLVSVQIKLLMRLLVESGWLPLRALPG